MNSIHKIKITEIKKIIPGFIFFFAWKNAVIIFPALVFFSNYLHAQAPSVQWQKCLGGSNSDYANSIQQTIDGRYIVAGFAYSNDGDVSGNHGVEDCWVVKLDVSGNIQWQKCLGGSNTDGANSIQQTNDGGYIVAGGLIPMTGM